MARLGDLCDILNGYAFKSEQYVGSGIRIIRIANVQKGYIEDSTPVFYPIDNNEYKKYGLMEGDLLLSLTGNVGRVALLQKEFLPAALNQRVACLRIKDETILSKSFLFNFLNSDYFENKCIESAKGVAQKNMSTEWLKEYDIPLLAIEKQEKISKGLDQISNLIFIRKQQLSKLDELVKSRFIELFGDPVADSMKWGQLPLSYYLKSIRYGTSTPPSFSEIGYEFIRATNIKNGQILSSDMKYISEEEAKKIEKCKVFGGEMIIVRSGVNAGDTCIITGEHCGQYAGYDMILVFGEALHPVFANVLINTEYMDRVVKPLTRRAAQPHPNSEQVQSLPIIQVPYAQQEQFAVFVEQTDKSKFEIQKSLEKLETLKKALMQKYFG